MNLYLLTRTDHWSYDDYDSCVVRARTSKSAKAMAAATLSAWPSDPSCVKAEIVRAKGVKAIVLASFNAG